MDRIVLLFMAIQSRDISTLNELLTSDAKLANFWRFDPIATPLHACVFNPVSAKILLEHGASPNAIDNDDNLLTPVHACASLGDDQTLDVLLKNGGDANARSKWGTPLHLALGNGETPLPEGYMKVLTALLDSGADVNAAVAEVSDQWTPLHQACSEGLEDAARLFIEHGAKVHLGKDGLTPMMVARSMGFSSIVQILESSGA